MWLQPAGQRQDAGRCPTTPTGRRSSSRSTTRPASSRTPKIQSYKEEGAGRRLYQRGREWHPKGQPEKVNVHDFKGELGKAVPYKVYDVAANTGWGQRRAATPTRASSASSRWESIRRWWARSTRRPTPRDPAAHHCQLRRLQRRLATAVEGRAGQARRTDRPGHRRIVVAHRRHPRRGGRLGHPSHPWPAHARRPRTGARHRPEARLLGRPSSCSRAKAAPPGCAPQANASSTTLRSGTRPGAALVEGHPCRHGRADRRRPRHQRRQDRATPPGRRRVTC
jgi:Rhodopirellula transposase DDE domain